MLWTNSNPSSGWAGGYVTLSQSMTNFDYLKVSFYSNTGTNKVVSVIFSVSDFKTMNTDPYFRNMVSPMAYAYYTWMYRGISYSSDTSILIDANSAGKSDMIIPVAIYGMKI